MFEEFLSDAECDGLRRVHNKHVQDQSTDDPILCFDSVSTLRKHLKHVGKVVKVSPRDFTDGRSYEALTHWPDIHKHITCY